MGFVGVMALNACSSSNGGAPTDAATDTPVGVKVTVSGVAAPHPLTAPVGMNPATDFSMLAVAVVDPVAVLADPNATPLAGGALDTSAGNCGTSGCAWHFDNVDISKISIGLVGVVDDTRTPAASRLWIKTGTGAGSIDFINMIIANPMPITGVPLFVVSKATEARLALGAAAALSDPAIVAGSLETRGFMIGTVLSKRTDSPPTPVEGATITTADTAMRLAILYPNATFNGFGAATASHGMFLAIPKSATSSAVVTDWTVTGPSGGSLTWPTYKAGTSPGTAFVLLMPAN